jgi:hypothetical protein
MSCDTPPDNDNAAIELPDTLDLDFYAPIIDVDPGPPDNGRRVKITWTVSRYVYGDGTDGIRVRITAGDAALMSAKVFAYLALPLRPGETTPTGAFDHVCSPTDLEEYPEDEPTPNSRPAWFRLNYVDVLLRSRAEVKEFIRDVVEDVQRLKRTLDVMDDLLPGGELWIGQAPAP